MPLPPQLRWGIITVGCALGLCVSAFSAPPPVPKERLHSRILGCLVGNSIGDAFGGVVEFADSNRVHQIAGTTWVDQFLPNKKVYGIDLEANARHFGAVVYGLSDP